MSSNPRKYLEDLTEGEALRRRPTLRPPEASRPSTIKSLRKELEKIPTPKTIEVEEPVKDPDSY